MKRNSANYSFQAEQDLRDLQDGLCGVAAQADAREEDVRAGPSSVALRREPYRGRTGVQAARVGRPAGDRTLRGR